MLLRLPRDLRADLLRQARAARPQEACGLLVGSRVRGELRVERVPALPNVDPRPGRFEAHPGAVVVSFDLAAARGREILGIWHSHPDGTARLSRADRRSFEAGGWPATWVQLAVGLARGGGPRLRAWRADGEGRRELDLAADGCEAPG